MLAAGLVACDSAVVVVAVAAADAVLDAVPLPEDPHPAAASTTPASTTMAAERAAIGHTG
jgi:hypothetical protein